MLRNLRGETLALGEEKIPALAKHPQQVEWEQRHSDYDKAHVPYDR